MIIRPVIPNHIIQDEGKKQKQNTQEGKKKGTGQGRQAGKAVDVDVVIENGIKQYPAGGYDQGAEEKFGAVEVVLICFVGADFWAAAVVFRLVGFVAVVGFHPVYCLGIGFAVVLYFSVVPLETFASPSGDSFLSLGRRGEGAGCFHKPLRPLCISVVSVKRCRGCVVHWPVLQYWSLI